MYVLSHSTKVPPIFKGGEDKSLPFLGFEIEVLKLDKKGNDRQIINDYADVMAGKVSNGSNGLLYCKHDGSITDGYSSAVGLEVVSHPFTLEWIHGNQKALSFCDGLRRNGYTSYQNRTCGMHVHLNKKACSRLQIFKMYKFLSAHEKLIYQIAMREGEWFERYCSIKKIKRLGDAAQESEEHDSFHDKYVALRNQQVMNTIEFRVFKGSLIKSTIMRNLEFVHSMWNYTNSASIDDIYKITVYTGFIMDNRNIYPHLYEWLTDKHNIHNKSQKNEMELSGHRDRT